LIALGSFFKHLGICSICVFSLLGIITFAYSIFYTFGLNMRFSSLFTHFFVSVNAMWAVFITTILLVICSTAISLLVRQNIILKKSK